MERRERIRGSDLAVEPRCFNVIFEGWEMWNLLLEPMLVLLLGLFPGYFFDKVTSPSDPCVAGFAMKLTDGSILASEALLHRVPDLVIRCPPQWIVLIDAMDCNSDGDQVFDAKPGAPCLACNFTRSDSASCRAFQAELQPPDH